MNDNLRKAVKPARRRDVAGRSDDRLKAALKANMRKRRKLLRERKNSDGQGTAD
ncbi:MAG: hypothetical protein OXF74_12890 [Rhodobacteraceae bacterium]|nr:hypothetical protein [Paracoccaceae bacterium]